MPDQHGFHNEPHWGTTFHRCSLCPSWKAPWGRIIPEAEREAHAAMHEAERQERILEARRKALSVAR